MVAEGILVVPHLHSVPTDGDCHKGKICDNGECKKPKRQACVQDSDCNEGQICKNGECHKQPNPNLPEAQPNLPPTCDPTTQSCPRALYNKEFTCDGEGENCYCRDSTKEYVGNACVPKCGDGATRDGDTCYCTDPTKEYCR